jgi:flagellar biosynthetic protein FliP
LTLALLLAAPLALAADPLSIPAITLSNTADGAAGVFGQPADPADHDRAELHPGVRHPDDQLHPIIIVFSILRQALGLQQTPSNQMLTGMALFLTMFIMAPVFDRVNQDALQPYLKSR